MNAWPYAVYKLKKGGDPEFNSDGSYTQDWLLTMATFNRQGLDINPNGIQIAMNSAMNSPPGQPSGILLRDGKVLHCLPTGVIDDFDPELWDARSIFVAAGTWKILVDGNVNVGN